ncbi:DUF4097 family beta strand repeat-containing protein [Actinocorallia populi]|uniref:DUF4097 family beta strand repeat-containing protein n=1 Tax=Actinocorallia populi TaxID=2079200 RepID=UPI000D087AC6|nr:DUF4097 family beta strand repeat-containing protein [Actinocorallia populi]
MRFPTPTPISTVLDVPAGRIQLIADDRADTTVEVRPADPSRGRDVKAAERIRVEYGEGVLRIEDPAADRLLGSSGSVEVTVRLPAGSALRARTASAEFRVVGRLGEIDYENAHGWIEIDEAAGARIAVEAGDVHISRLDGPGQIRTAKGDIRVTEAVRGTLVLDTQAGDLTVGAAPGVSATLDAGTSYGRITNALRNTEGAAAGLAIQATTAYGDITARSL